jgi:hypothetical protein
LVTEDEINRFLSEIKFKPGEKEKEKISYPQFKEFLQKVLALQSLQEAAELDLSNEEVEGNGDDPLGLLEEKKDLD